MKGLYTPTRPRARSPDREMAISSHSAWCPLWSSSWVARPWWLSDSMPSWNQALHRLKCRDLVSCGGGESQVRPSVLEVKEPGAGKGLGPPLTSSQAAGEEAGPQGGWWITAVRWWDSLWECCWWGQLMRVPLNPVNPSLSSLSSFHNLTVSCSRFPPYILSAFLIALPGWGDDGSPAHCVPPSRPATSCSHFIPDAARNTGHWF